MQPRSILVAVRTHAGYGQRIIDGILDFAERKREWDFELIREKGGLVGRDLSSYHGVIGEFREEAEIRMALESGKTVVAVTGERESIALPTVIADNIAVGRLAARWFGERGFRQFAYFGLGSSQYIHERARGFEAEIAGDAADGFDRFDPEAWRDGPLAPLPAWLSSLPKPIGVLAAEDSGGVRIANACRELGLRVPEDVAIMGVDNDERLCRMSVPPLSSIDHGARRIGYEAAALLERLIDGEPAPEQPVLIEPVEVVVRQSTDTYAIADEDVASAVRYIRDHACDGIDVRDVLRELPIARRTLEAKFRRVLGRTILQEINRVRVGYAKRLLTNTKASLAEICELAGFSYPSRLSLVIKQQTGLSPRQYRDRFGRP